MSKNIPTEDAMPGLAQPLTFRFENFQLDKQARELFRLGPDGQITKVQLGSRAFQILCLLVERRGGIVTRQEMMDAVWPDVVVEENNLAVQLSKLRRALDSNRDLGSCIQTLPGRGYRFIPPVTHANIGQLIAHESTALSIDCAESQAPPDADGKATGQLLADSRPEAEPVSAAQRRPQRRIMAWIASLCGCFAFLVAVVAWFAAATPGSVTPRAPAVSQSQWSRQSVVVLPFNRLGDELDDDTVNGIVDDLTTALARSPTWQVIARHTAFSYKGKPINIKRVGDELGVRFAVEGSVRKIGSALRINIQLL